MEQLRSIGRSRCTIRGAGTLLALFGFMAAVSALIASTAEANAAPAIEITQNGRRLGALQSDPSDPRDTANIARTYGQHLVLPFTASTRFAWPDPNTRVEVNVYRLVKNGSSSRSAEACSDLQPDGAAVSIVPSRIQCASGSYLDQGGVIELVLGDSGSETTYLADIPDRNLPVYGSDLGITLTLTDKLHDTEGFRSDGAASAYYSLTKVKSKRFRAIANLSLLDFDPDQDFEIGFGLGLLFRTASESSGSQNGLGISVGYGYNLMIHESENALYGFVGVGWNMSREAGVGGVAP